MGETTESTEDRAAGADPPRRPRADKAARRARRHHDPDPACRRERHRGQARHRPARDHRDARRGPPAHRGRARRRQDDARQGARPVGRLLGAPHAVHARPAAQRHHRRVDLQPGAPRVRVQARRDLRATSWSATRSTGPRPKTQSALLECMEERQVTVDGATYELAMPFMVIATQNPIEMEGTYPLPEAQRDRFMARISMGYPERRGRAGDARHATAQLPAGRPAGRWPTPPRSPS